MPLWKKQKQTAVLCILAGKQLFVIVFTQRFQQFKLHLISGLFLGKNPADFRYFSWKTAVCFYT